MISTAEVPPPFNSPKEHPIGGPTCTETKCNERVNVKAEKKTPRVSRLDESYCQRVSICKEKRVAEGGEGSFVMSPAANKKIEEHELEQRKETCCFFQPRLAVESEAFSLYPCIPPI